MSNLIISYINFDQNGNINTDTFNPSTFVSDTLQSTSVNTQTINVSGNSVTNNIDDYGIIDAENIIINQSAIFSGTVNPNSTSLCTTAYLEQRFNELLGQGTVDQLNSIKELADSLNNDTNFFLTVQNQFQDISTNYRIADNSLNLLSQDISQNLLTLDVSLNGLISTHYNELTSKYNDISSYAHSEDILLQNQINDISDDLIFRVTDISNDIINYKSYVDSVFVDVNSHIDTSHNQLNTRINDLSSNTSTRINDLSSNIATSFINLTTYINDQDAGLQSNINTLISNVADAQLDIISLQSSTTTIINDISSYKSLNNARVLDISQTLLNSTTNLNNLITDLSNNHSATKSYQIDLSNNYNSYKSLNDSRVLDISQTLLNNSQADISLNNLVLDLSNNHNSTKAFQIDLSNNYNSYKTLNNTLTNDLSLSIVDLHYKNISIDSSLNSLYTSINTNINDILDISNSRATINYVDESISALLDSAPSTLNTLNELAEALGNDNNFSTTLSNSIGLRALDSAVVHLTGNENISGNKTFSGTISGITKSMVGLGNVNNTSDMDLPVSTATQTALNAKQNTITTNSLNISDISGLQTSINAKHDVISDGSLSIAKTSGLQTALNNKALASDVANSLALKQDVLTSSSITDNLLASTFIKENDNITLYVNKSFNMNGNIIADGKTISAIELSYLDNLTQPLPTTLTSLQNQINNIGGATPDLSGYQTLISDSNQIQQSNVSGLVTALSGKQSTLSNASFLDATSSVQTQLNAKQATLTNGSVSDAMLASTFVKPSTAPTLTGTNFTGIPTSAIINYSAISVETISGTTAISSSKNISIVSGSTHTLGTGSTVGFTKTIINNNPNAFNRVATTLALGGVIIRCLKYDSNLNRMYIGGNFTGINGVTNANTFCYYDFATSIFVSLGTFTGTDVYDILINGTRVYITGAFTLINSVANTVRIAYYDTSTSTWNAMGTGLSSGQGQRLLLHSGSVYVCGSFALAGGVGSTVKIARWNISGGTWNALGSGVTTGSIVKEMALIGTNIWICGDFTSAGSASNSTYLAYWDTSASSWNGYGTNQFNASVSSIKYIGGNSLIMNGGFSTLGTASINSTCNFNVSTLTGTQYGVGAGAVALTFFIDTDGVLWNCGNNNTDIGHFITGFHTTYYSGTGSIAFYSPSGNWVPITSGGNVYAMERTGTAGEYWLAGSFNGWDGTSTLGFASTGNSSLISFQKNNVTTVNSTLLHSGRTDRNNFNLYYKGQTVNLINLDNTVWNTSTLQPSTTPNIWLY